MNSKSPKKWLSNQEYQIMRRRRQLIEDLYNVLEELEGRPVRQPDYGFPFSLLASGINKTLDGVEGMVDKAVLKALTKLKKHKKGRKR